MGIDAHLIDPPDRFDPEWPDKCPDCKRPVDDEVYCQNCGAVLDPDEAAENERQEAYERLEER